MKVVIQRVAKASVSVSDELISSIQNGLCVLVGISRDDTDKDMDYIIKKILNIRLFKENETSARWDKSVVDKDFEILCVSQFTLQAVLKGNKPDFHQAMVAQKSKEIYDRFLDTIGKLYKKDKIKNGKFGEYMQVSIQNDGPVTIIIDSKKSQDKPENEEAIDP
jgi:D-tyrosyl-tRNA(Tyr) deacylase